MEIVIDANILFAILIKSGKTEDLLFEDNLVVYAPEFIFREFLKYNNTIKEKTEREDFDKFIKTIFKQIKVMPKEQFEKYLEKAKSISPDEKDSAYFALALYKKCPIWSNDKKLKEQKDVVVYSTYDLVKLFL